MITVLHTENITKEFATVRANHNISISLKQGEILGLLGENGAGKSTLMNILYGLFQPTAGEIYLHEQVVRFRSPKEAIRAGLGMVHQHFMLVDTLTVAENIILGSEPSTGNFINFKQARHEVAALAARHNLLVDPDATIVNVSVGIQQRVEILKALYRQANILILDEPTAVLTPQETAELFTIIRSLAQSGVSVILITHKLNEIKEISDRVYIMRRGTVVQDAPTKSITIQQLANAMVGREVKLIGRTIELTGSTEKAQTAAPRQKKAVMRLDGITIQNDRKLNAINHLSLHVDRGEIVGIAGVDGNGQEELAEGIVGLRRLLAGSIWYEGRDISKDSIKERIRMRIGYVPADRHKHGLVLPFTLQENIILGQHDTKQYNTHGVLKLHDIAARSAELVRDYDIRPTNTTNQATNLSGGNQQKMILAREFSRDPQFMVIAQPTRGLDIGAIEYIHKQILAMRRRNVAILLISLELEEIFALSDRILVLHKGAIVHEADPNNTTTSEIGLHMMGGNAPKTGGRTKKRTAGHQPKQHPKPHRRQEQR